MPPPLVIFHASCADGFCAAWVARRSLGLETEFVAANYGDPPPDVTGRKVYILDFSYKRPVLAEMRKKAEWVTLIDHHKTAAAELSGAEPIPAAENGASWLKTGEGKTDGVTVLFDMNKSGGRLTWDFFFGRSNLDRPWLVDYTEDRDLWRWKLDWSKEISAFIASYPFDFERWHAWSLYSPGCPAWDRHVDEGAAILRYQGRQVDDACKNAVEIEMDGHKVLSTNATMLISEIGEKLCQGRPFSATYFIRGDGKKIWSLRSREGGIDVSAVAKKRGGGGHLQAAGFTE